VITGVIEDFDDRRGYGYLADQTGQRFFFHCVDIVDGTRSIPNGAAASGVRAVGRLGLDEVKGVRVLD
jgi:cold shock CspA family protein